MDRYRQKPGMRAYKVTYEQGASCSWRVTFYVDRVECGGGQYQTSQQADDAGVDFMFSGDLDVQEF